ncbi:FecR domain-containing protein [Thermodesulfobacteriota bacterium]
MKLLLRKISDRCHNCRYAVNVAICVIMVVLSPVVSTATENTSVGIITDVHGDATVTRSDDQEISAEKNLPLYPGDQIVTGKNGVVGFSFNAGDVFRLNEDSRVSLDELIGSDEENPPVLRLSLGFLWSKIKLLIMQQNRQIVHTPTAVIGVRGTEFDTVVTEDSASTVTVDDGSVEVETEVAKRVVNQGLSTEVDMEEKILPSVKAIPPEQRNWQKYRRDKREKLIDRLPRHTTRLRKRFDREINRFLRFSKKITAHADRMNKQIKTLDDVRKKRDRTAVRQQLLDIKSQEQLFRPKAKQYRKAANRVRVIGRHTLHVKAIFEKNRDRFSDNEIEISEANIAAVSPKIQQLKQTARLTNKKIKRTYKQMKKLRNDIKKQRSGKKPKGRSKQEKSKRKN